MSAEVTLQQAKELDEKDPLKGFREKFLLPKQSSGEPYIYMCGNSLGLQPSKTEEYIGQELIDWKNLGVEGHFEAKNPWLPYHEFVAQSLARLMGAQVNEVVAMNSLTVNLHLMMTSFYRPTKTKYKILIEGGAFPSDQYAVASQARFHSHYLGFDPKEAILEIFPRDGETWVRTEDFVQYLENHKDEVAMVLLGGVNYLNGQLFELEPLCQKTHEIGAIFGVDLAHAAGNVPLKLHDWKVDFASWCSYKYMNSGPGGISGVFVHETHFKEMEKTPRFEGWWGHDKTTRFKMPDQFIPIQGAEAWQLSNPPIFQLAALKASLELFDEAGIENLRAKSEKLTGFLEQCLSRLDHIDIFTPTEKHLRGSQLSLTWQGVNKEKVQDLRQKGVICDFREPNIIRVAPTAMYNSFEDCWNFSEVMKSYGK